MAATRKEEHANTAGDHQDFPWLTKYPAGVDWNMTLDAAPIGALLERAAAAYGGHGAINFFGKKTSYQDLKRLVDQTAAGLQRIGVKKGTKVGLFLPNCPSFVVYYYAVAKAGGTVVNFNPLYTIEELEYQIKDSETEMMVTLDLKMLFDKIETLLASRVLTRAIVAPFAALLPFPKSVLFPIFKAKDRAHPSQSDQSQHIVSEASLLAGDPVLQPVTIDPVNDIVVLQYTGGTTGTPKGAMLTHANVSINALQAVAWATELEHGAERMFGGLPFFHVFAMTAVMNFAIAAGAEMIIMPRFILDDAMALITKTKPTLMPGVPTMFRAIINHKKLASFDLSSLKFCLSGGAPLPLELKREFEKLTNCKVVEGYGLSETSPIATINPLYGGAKEGSIGQPVPGTVISIRDLEDPRKQVPRGERGEICIFGPQVMRGYWKKPKETADVFVGNFLRTGDVGYMDDEGFTFIVDRIKDLIICSGYNVYPRRIEEAIYQHPAVDEVTVVGIKDTYRGEAPKAFVKLKPGQTASADDILKFLVPKISRIEMPAEIEFRDTLPKTMIGKLSKKELKAEEGQKASSA